MSEALSETPQNLLAFSLDALRKIGAQHALQSPHRNTWSDSHADLYDSELEFLPYRPAAAALSDWFYDHDLVGARLSLHCTQGPPPPTHPVCVC